MNENYPQPAMPEGVEEGIRAACTGCVSQAGARPGCSCWAAGTILREVEAAAELLEKDFDIAADVWSVTSFNELRATASTPSAGTCCTRRARAQPYVSEQLGGSRGPSSPPPTT
jgi:pyruvate dehydrogenase E1 component